MRPGVVPQGHAGLQWGAVARKPITDKWRRDMTLPHIVGEDFGEKIVDRQIRRTETTRRIVLDLSWPPISKTNRDDENRSRSQQQSRQDKLLHGAAPSLICPSAARHPDDDCTASCQNEIAAEVTSSAAQKVAPEG